MNRRHPFHFVNVTAPTPDEFAARQRGEDPKTVTMVDVTAPSPEELKAATEAKASVVVENDGDKPSIIKVKK